MAKKAAKKQGKKKGSSGKKSGMMSGFDITKIGGIAGGVYVGRKLDALEFTSTWDPKMKAGAKILIGELAPKQAFVRNMVKNDSLVRGFGDGLIAQGAEDLLTEMGFMQGIGNRQMEDDDELVVVIDGVDDLDVVNDDVLGDDDLDVVNDDVLGDDDY